MHRDWAGMVGGSRIDDDEDHHRDPYR